MKLLFVSNYFTHHQKTLCENLDRLTNHSFTFVEIEEFSQERKNMGWNEENDVSYVHHCFNDSKINVSTMLNSADVILWGSAPLELFKKSLANGKLVFRYAERIFKNGYEPLKWGPRFIRFWQRYGRYQSLYMLAASAYTAVDYAMHGAFVGKCYKWGYFPETKNYNLELLMSNKDTTKLLWCGRFLEWKHPEEAIEIAKRLKKEGYKFCLELIGTGDLEIKLKQIANENNLSDCVRFLGPMCPEQVRTRMEKAGIYLFTSDFHEGWGAVLNEAMNSGCAVVASHAIGSVPFLLKHQNNGLIYKNSITNDLYCKVKYLLDNKDEQRKIGENAYHTIVDLWNAKVAAERFIKLVEEIRDHGYCDLFSDGPCSKAEVIRNNWFKE